MHSLTGMNTVTPYTDLPDSYYSFENPMFTVSLILLLVGSAAVVVSSLNANKKPGPLPKSVLASIGVVTLGILLMSSTVASAGASMVKQVSHFQSWTEEEYDLKLDDATALYLLDNRVDADQYSSSVTTTLLPSGARIWLQETKTNGYVLYDLGNVPLPSGGKQ